MTAEMTAEGLPLAPEAVDGEPTTEGTPEEEKSRRRKKALLLLLLGLLAMLITIALWYLLFRQPISPLPPIPETQIPGYTTSIYGATRPTGVAVSPSGDRIYVTQSGGDRTSVVFDAAGTKLATMAPPAATGTNHVPVYAAVDPLTEEVYVSDRPMGTVYIYNRDGLFQRELTLAEPRPGWQPMALAFDAAGLLYVTDLSGPYQKVLVIDRSASVVRTVGENESLNFPNGVGVDTAGNVYVTDSNNGRLLAFDGTGKVVAKVGRGTGQGNLGLPRGLGIDMAGRVFVVDTSGHATFIYKVASGDNRRLEYLGAFGGEGVADGQFAYPTGVAIDARGRVYVADTFNDRVQIWSY
jgi:tripartite motif-containing protein 71